MLPFSQLWEKSKRTVRFCCKALLRSVIIRCSQWLVCFLLFWSFSHVGLVCVFIPYLCSTRTSKEWWTAWGNAVPTNSGNIYVAKQVPVNAYRTAENSEYCCARRGVVSLLHTLCLIWVMILKCIVLSCMHASLGRRNIDNALCYSIIHARLSGSSEPASTNFQLRYKSSRDE